MSRRNIYKSATANDLLLDSRWCCNRVKVLFKKFAEMRTREYHISHTDLFFSFEVSLNSITFSDSIQKNLDRKRKIFCFLFNYFSNFLDWKENKTGQKQFNQNAINSSLIFFLREFRCVRGKYLYVFMVCVNFFQLTAALYNRLVWMCCLRKKERKKMIQTKRYKNTRTHNLIVWYASI